MTQDHSSKLSFSIEESVWLNKGQEVDEIISLSLDPEITVQEQGEYVLIRGGLKLTGEYRSNSNPIATEETESLASQVAFRSIEEVTLNEDGTGEIRHHFPIDVTIPQERIRSLDDIYVIVDSFDYDLPERGCIQLTADISITGMSTGTSKREVLEERSEVEEERNFHFESFIEEPTDEETVVAFPTGQTEDEIEVERVEEEQNVILDQAKEITLETSEEVNSEVTEVEEVRATQEVDQVLEEVRSIQEVDQASEVEVLEEDQERSEEVAEAASEVVAVEEVVPEADVAEFEVASVEVKEVNVPTIAFGVVKDRPKDTDEVAEKSEAFSLSKSFPTTRQKEVKQQQAETRKDNQAAEKVESQEVEAKTQREENALYLTKMLTKGEGEQFKKLKICIIRENETLETIAARYEMTTSTLIRVNRLNDANVTEGQILYIPVTQ